MRTSIQTAVRVIVTVLLLTQPGWAGDEPKGAARRVLPTLSPDARYLRLSLSERAELGWMRLRLLEGERATTWVGTLPGTPGSRLYLTFPHEGAGLVVGEASVPGAQYRVLGVGDVWSVTKSAETRTDVKPSPAPVRRGLGRPRLQRGPTREQGLHRRGERLRYAHAPSSGLVDLRGPRIDVLVVYSGAARYAASLSMSPPERAQLIANGFDPGAVVMEAWAENAVATANDVFLNSGIHAHVRLVHAAEIELDETFDYAGQYLDWLYVTANNGSHPIHQLRATHAADIVSLWVKDAGTLKDLDRKARGIAEPLSLSGIPALDRSLALNVIDSDARSGYTFAHELGHNMGAAHDRYVVDNPPHTGTGAFPYSHGYVYISSSSLPSIKTVMAYDNACDDAGVECMRLPYFSSPDIVDQGIPLGIAGQADNARTLNRTADYVSHFMPPQSMPPLPTP